MSIACHLVNRSSALALEFKTLEELWSSNPPIYSHLRIFECPIYFYIGDGKLEPIAKMSIFLCYASRVKRYKLCCTDPKLPKFIISRDFTFNETTMLFSKKDKFVILESILKESSTIKVELDGDDNFL